MDQAIKEWPDVAAAARSSVNESVNGKCIWANQCKDLKQARKHIEEDSENTDHLNSHISNIKLKKFCLRRFFYYLSHIRHIHNNDFPTSCQKKTNKQTKNTKGNQKNLK